MKQRMFDSHLYREALRQTRVPGIIFIILMVLLCFVIPGDTAIYALLRGSTGSPSVVNILEVYPFLPVLIYLAAPALTLRLFRFMNQRSQSDFYQALPWTRGCMYGSFSAAIFTWVAAAAVAGLVVEIVYLQCLPNLYTLNLASVWPYLCAVLAGSFLTMAVTLTAMGMTGTLAANILMTILLLFLPRAALALMIHTLSGISSVVIFGSATGLLRAALNIPAGMLLNLITGEEDVAVSLTTWLPCLYTLVLGILYYAGGLLLHRRRPSEVAQSAAANRYARAAFRIACSMPLCLCASLEVFTCMADPDAWSYTLTSILILYVLGLLVYFLFELLATRSARSLLHSFPGLGIVLLLNVGIIGLASGIYSSELYFLPSSSEIASVSINYVESSTDYIQAQSKNVEITDPEAIQIVQQALTEAVGIEAIHGSQPSSSTRMQVVIRTDTQEKYRKIYLRDADYALLMERAGTCAELVDLYQNLPDYDACTNIMAGFIDDVLAEEDLIALYDTVRQELSALDFAEAYACMTHPYYYETDEDDISPLDTLELTVVDGVNIYYLEVPVLPKLMPESCALYAELVNAAYPDTLQHVLAYLQLCVEEGMDASIVEIDTDELSYYEEQYIYTVESWLKTETCITADTVGEARTLLDFLQSWEPAGEEYIVLYYEHYIWSYSLNYDDAITETWEDIADERYVLRVDSSLFSEEFREMFG